MVKQMFRYCVCFFTSFLLFSGCVTKVPPPGFIVSDQIQLGDFYGSKGPWERVLKKYVDSQGRIAFKQLSSDYVDLLFYLDYISKTSPRLKPQDFPDEEHKLAFYINSYNALAMYGVVYHNLPKDFHGFVDRAGFFKFTKYNVGDRYISLYDYENKIIRPLGDPRVHFALNCMVVDCPRLPIQPFNPEILDFQLNEAAIEFLNDPKKVYVDSVKKEVMFSEILKFYQEDFVYPDQASSLIEYVNRFRKEKIPPSYKVGFFKYDWTLNSQ